MPPRFDSAAMTRLSMSRNAASPCVVISSAGVLPVSFKISSSASTKVLPSSVAALPPTVVLPAPGIAISTQFERSARSAVVMVSICSSGSGWPQNSSAAALACATSMASPPVAGSPSSAARCTSAVCKGLYTTSATACNWGNSAGSSGMSSFCGYMPHGVVLISTCTSRRIAASR